MLTTEKEIFEAVRLAVNRVVETEVERVFDKTLRQRIVQILYEIGVPAKEDLKKLVTMEVTKQQLEAGTPGRNYAALLDTE